VRRRIFAQELVLLALLIASTCAAMVVFEVLLSRDQYRQHCHGKALFLAQQLDKPLTWEDRFSISELLRQAMATDPLLRYAFVERDGKAYLHTFPTGVPAGLLGLYSAPGPAKMERLFSDAAGGAFYDIAVRIGRNKDILHLGLDRRRVDGRAEGPVAWILFIGAIFFLLMIYPAYRVACMITQQIETMTGRLTDARDQLEIRVAERTQELQQANGSLQNQATRILESVDVLSATAGEISTFCAQLAASATESAAAVTETTITVEEVRQTTELASRKAQQVADSAQKTAQITLAGRESTEATLAGMQNIHQQMVAIAESMKRLIGQTQAIGQIIGVVDDLAAQSNILAINAAIEAAKAGEQGKGFTVVAQEVKNLARQSKEATAQVRTILNDIQKASRAAVMVTEQGTKAVENGERQSAQAGESIQTLAASVNESAQAAAQIATINRQQMVGVDQVVAAMQSIKQASTQNENSAKQLEISARNLDLLGQKLKALVKR
jgi:methyl-accepting chemotaxis protein